MRYRIVIEICHLFCIWSNCLVCLALVSNCIEIVISCGHGQKLPFWSFWSRNFFLLTVRAHGGLRRSGGFLSCGQVWVGLSRLKLALLRLQKHEIVNGYETHVVLTSRGDYFNLQFRGNFLKCLENIWSHYLKLLLSTNEILAMHFYSGHSPICCVRPLVIQSPHDLTSISLNVTHVNLKQFSLALRLQVKKPREIWAFPLEFLKEENLLQNWTKSRNIQRGANLAQILEMWVLQLRFLRHYFHWCDHWQSCIWLFCCLRGLHWGLDDLDCSCFGWLFEAICNCRHLSYPSNYRCCFQNRTISQLK